MRWLVFEKLCDIVSRGEAALAHHRTGACLFGVEVTLNDPVFLRELDERDHERIRETLLPHERTVHVPFYGLNLGCFDRWIADYSEWTIREGIDFCRAIGSDRAVTHTTIPAYVGEDAFPKWRDRFLERMVRLEDHAARNGVTLAWENTYERDFALFDAMIASHPTVSFCLDVGHAHCFAKRPIADFVAHLGRRIRHAHLHDNDGLDDRHWPIGKGTISFSGLNSLFSETARDSVVFELDRDDFLESLPHIERLFGLRLTSLPLSCQERGDGKPG